MFVGLSASTQSNNGDPTALLLVSGDGMHTAPSYITSSAMTLMSRSGQEMPAFSSKHWQDGDHTVVNMFGMAGKFEIMWTDLEATSTTKEQGGANRSRLCG